MIGRAVVTCHLFAALMHVSPHGRDLRDKKVEEIPEDAFSGLSELKELCVAGVGWRFRGLSEGRGARRLL